MSVGGALKIAGALTAALLIGIWAILAFRPEPEYAPFQPSTSFVRLAQQYANENIPPPPAGWRFSQYVHDDGARLRWGVAAPLRHPRATVVFIPGFKNTLDTYFEPIGSLIDRGYKVIGLDMRGQGGSHRMLSNPEKYTLDDFDQLARDIDGFIASVEGEIEGPLVIVGQSMGALAALRSVGAGTEADALVLQVPPIRIDTGEYSLQEVRRLTRFLRLVGFARDYAPGEADWTPFTEDFLDQNWCGPNRPARAHLKDAIYTLKPEVRVGGLTNEMLSELIEAGERSMEQSFLRRVTIPVLMVTAGADRVVDSAAAQRVCDDLPNCRLLDFPDAGHCINFERADIVVDMYDALDALVAALA